MKIFSKVLVIVLLICGFLGVNTSFAEGFSYQRWRKFSVKDTHDVYTKYYNIFIVAHSQVLDILLEEKKKFPHKRLGVYFDISEIEGEYLITVEKILDDSGVINILQKGDRIFSIAGEDLVKFRGSREDVGAKINEIIAAQDGQYEIILWRRDQQKISVMVENTLFGDTKAKKLDNSIALMKKIRLKFDLLKTPNAFKENEKIPYSDINNIIDLNGRVIDIFLL